jgi:hypothetical protein
MSYDITPLEVCERLIGSIEGVSVAAGLGPKAAYSWRYKTKVRSAGDLPSGRVQRKLLTYAAKNNIPLTTSHLILGADSAEIDALVATKAAELVAAE